MSFSSEPANTQRALPETALLLSAIVESSDDAIVSKDLNGVVTSWNQSATRIFGYTSAEMIGRSITLIIPPELLDQEPRILAKIRAGERIEHFETVRVAKSGARVYVSLSISPMKDSSGKIIGAAKIVRDITHQKAIESDARLLSAIVESSDDAIVSKDLNGIVTSWNPSASRMFGYTPAEIIGKPITLLIPPELQDQEPQILAKIRAGERIEHFQTVRVTKSGVKKEVSLSISPIKDASGTIVGAAKIVRDITKERKVEGALRLTERLASVGRLAATVAHEINNPLEAVVNFIYLARKQPNLPESAERYLANADKELVRVAHIAQQTLGFYRGNSLPAAFSVGKVISDVVTVYERRLQYKELILKKDIEEGLTVFMLQGEMKQILSNLLANAIDASPQRGKIEIRARSARDFRSRRRGVRITIADQGVGIPSSDRKALFTPFFTTKKDVGTGLGLWITKDLLEKEGGNIRVRSRVSSPSGTVMRLYLPLVETVANA